MIGWTKRFFRRQRAENRSTTAERDSALLERFEVLLADRMNKFGSPVRDAFAKLLDADFSDSVEGLHIEVFMDGPVFSFILLGQGKNGVWANEPEPVKELNDTIDRLWPIITQDELDQYTIWEDDPEWGRQVALEQPLDKLNVAGIVIPWFRKIVSETRGEFSHTITVSIHDITLPEEL